MKTILSTSALALTVLAGAAHAHSDATQHRPDDHAPIGVMRDHVHGKGDFMLSYRLGYMYMNENLDNTSKVSDQDVLNNYMVSPTDMSMKMHMFGGMYGVTDQLTLSLMTSFHSREMDHIRRNDTTFLMENSSMGDTSVNALYELFNNGSHRAQLNLGLSLPTGSIDDKKNDGSQFGYPMQPGSGTYDLLPGVSYSGHNTNWSWGGQLNAVLRLGENGNDYTLGDRYQATAWAARKLNDRFSVSFRLDGQTWDEIDGLDPLIGTNFMAPPMDPSLQGGERIDALVGVNYLVQEGGLKGHRFAVELGMPAYERLDGPRLNTEYRVMFGWQKAF